MTRKAEHIKIFIGGIHTYTLLKQIYLWRKSYNLEIDHYKIM